MIDHVSVAVRDLARSAAFYERLLAPLGYTRLVERPASIGFGKKYPELWLNLRADMSAAPTNPGSHVALRASSEERRARLPRRGVGGGRCERGRAGTQAGGDDDLLRRLRARPRRQQAGSDVVPGGVAGFYAAANTNPSSGSTGRSGGGPTSSRSSPTRRRSCGSSTPSRSSRTTRRFHAARVIFARWAGCPTPSSFHQSARLWRGPRPA